ncbi:hypothetical protein M419DRAFT_13336 [Trichoderma reesei RUT C-30]|jgi:hypothetical protein|uniref:Uncharacterized protein n=1 Tax=Hypocrea jecorina (strain ATCC 56765 / BCRC 32924 / NRRL 11460 / Rut C-30) TaxID=1344414 RepID=A0A024RUJ6_HYPJR|nr:hypothetical protein M419DRAFT_13336 [Trichoderma reesei RUT C-30]
MSFHVPGNQPPSRLDHSRRPRTYVAVTLQADARLLILSLGQETRQGWNMPRRLYWQRVATIVQVVLHVEALRVRERCLVLVSVYQPTEMPSGTDCSGVVPTDPSDEGLQFPRVSCHALVTRLLVSWTLWSGSTAVLLCVSRLALPRLDSSTGDDVAHGEDVVLVSRGSKEMVKVLDSEVST